MKQEELNRIGGERSAKKREYGETKLTLIFFKVIWKSTTNEAS